jgi:hypothetical protein
MFMAYSCDSGPMTWGGVGFIPEISLVNITDDNNQTIDSSSIHDDDELYFYIKSEDDDLNIKTLLINLCTQDDSHTLLDGPYDISLPQQTDQIVYYTHIGPITLDEPAGSYSLVFQIVDGTGNVSKDYILDITIL